MAKISGDESPSRLESILLVMFVAAFTAPSLMLNIGAAQLSLTVAQLSHGTVAQLSLNVATVAAAPLFCHATISLAQQGRATVAATVGCIFALTVGYNLATALGNVALSRATVAESRTTVAGEMSRLETKQSQLSRDLDRARETSQGVSVDMASQEVSTLRRNTLYARSSQCTNATVQDSIDFCTMYGSAEMKMLAAKEAARIRLELDGVDLALGRFGTKPTDSDPQVANLAMLAGAVSAPVDERWMGVIMNAYAAVIAELIGAFSPIVFMSFRRRGVPPIREMIGAVPAAAEPALEPLPPAQVALPVGVPLPAVSVLGRHPLDEFIQSCIRNRKGATISGNQFLTAYTGFCLANGHEVLSMRKLSPMLLERGFSKDRGRVVRYMNVELII